MMDQVIPLSPQSVRMQQSMPAVSEYVDSWPGLADIGTEHRFS